MGVFVKGAPAFLSSNIQPTKGLANGSAVTLHSLTFADPVEQQRCNDRICSTSSGAIIELPYIPSSINVHLAHSAYAWAPVGSLLPGAFVIPVVCCDSHDVSVSWCCRSHSLTIRMHAVDLAFSMAFSKVQGKNVGTSHFGFESSPIQPRCVFHCAACRNIQGWVERSFAHNTGTTRQTIEYLLRIAPDVGGPSHLAVGFPSFWWPLEPKPHRFRVCTFTFVVMSHLSCFSALSLTCWFFSTLIALMQVTTSFPSPRRLDFFTASVFSVSTMQCFRCTDVSC